jgi:hypothetical protein
MAWAQWMRVFDTVSGLIQVAARMRRPEAADPGGLQTSTGGGPLGQLEARLAGVVVAALKEAFDRDSARLELERAQIESERRRAEEALRAELRRQAADRLLGGLKIIALVSTGAWALSAALGVWLPGMREGAARMILGAGWLLAFAALACSFAGWQTIAAWSSASGANTDLPRNPALSAAPWLLIGALLLTATSLLIALSHVST